MFPIAALLFFAAAAFGLFCGSTPITLGDIFSAVKNGAVGTGERIFLFVRLPRTLGCLLAGAALAVAGGLIQNVLANSLASPSIIGVNAGAGLAVTLCTALGLYGGWQLSFFAFLGAFGAVSLVSLLVPHAVRRLGVTLSRRLLPLCALFGGAFVTLCDTAARTLFAPYEIPVGILMAFLGAPFFLFILFKGKGGALDA